MVEIHFENSFNSIMSKYIMLKQKVWLEHTNKPICQTVGFQKEILM